MQLPLLARDARDEGAVAASGFAAFGAFFCPCRGDSTIYSWSDLRQLHSAAFTHAQLRIKLGEILAGVKQKTLAIENCQWPL